jgi:phenolic acid decarboxylase
VEKGQKALEELRAEKAKKKPKHKTGGMTSVEKKEVADLVDKGWSDADIAKKLNRLESQVMKYRTRFLRVGDGVPLSEVEIKDQVLALRKRPEYGQIKLELLPLEIPMFEHEYAKLMTQLQDDITPTDEIQIFQMAKYQILMHRNLKDTRRSLEQIDNLNEIISQIVMNDNVKDPVVQERISTFQNQINALQIAQKSRTEQYKTYDEKLLKTIESLKFTRDQRLDKIDSNKRATYIDVIKDLADEDKLRKADIQNKLMIAAMKKVEKEWGSYHTFGDGELDRPILTPATVMAAEE